MQSKIVNTRSPMIGAGPISMTVTAVITVLIVTALTLASPRRVQADQDSMYLVCPGPILEGNSGQMGVGRFGLGVTLAVVFTDHQDHTADSNDYKGYDGARFQSGPDDSTLWVPVVTREDSRPEHDETFGIGFWDDGEWHGCVVTIEDDDAPEIVNVTIPSYPLDMYAFRAGDSIAVVVEFDQEVDVEGTPLVGMRVGDGDDASWRSAEYNSGSGTRSLVFRYRVRPEDFDSDGIDVGAASSWEDRTSPYGFTGNIYARGTDVPIDYEHPAVEGDWRQRVDGRPYVRSARITSSPSDGWQAYRANEVVEVSLIFNTAVMIEGDVSVGLYLEYDANARQVTREADYLRGSGTNILVFGYTVRPGDASHDGVGLILGTERTGFGGTGAIKARGTDVERNPHYLGSPSQPDHKIDTSVPSVSSVSITSEPTDGEAYVAGETITVAVVFDEEVTPSGAPQIELDVGGTARQATLVSGPGRNYASTLVFQYEVRRGDADSDGIGIYANSLDLNGGGIHDSAGNAAGLSHDVVQADSGHKVAISR